MNQFLNKHIPNMIFNCNVGIITINYNNETYMRTEIVEMYYFYFFINFIIYSTWSMTIIDPLMEPTITKPMCYSRKVWLKFIGTFAFFQQYLVIQVQM